MNDAIRHAFRFTLAIALLLCAAPVTRGEDQPSLNDEFSDAATLRSWTILSVDGRPRYDRMDVGETRDGWLTLVPTRPHAWYRDGMGPMLAKPLTGDFMVETRVETHARNEPSQPPRGHYNSGGLIVRDPASAEGRQNWVVVNVGRQAPHTGTEVKTTVNSDSHLELQQGPHNGRIRLARIGTTVYCLRKLEGEAEWTLIRTFDRPDLPDGVEVGLMANAWSDQGDCVAQYDYVRYTTPTSPADLTADAPEPAGE